MTKEQAEYLNKNRNIDILTTPVCDACKKTKTVKTFSKILSWEKTNG